MFQVLVLKSQIGPYNNNQRTKYCLGPVTTIIFLRALLYNLDTAIFFDIIKVNKKSGCKGDNPRHGILKGDIQGTVVSREISKAR